MVAAVLVTGFSIHRSESHQASGDSKKSNKWFHKISCSSGFKVHPPQRVAELSDARPSMFIHALQTFSQIWLTQRREDAEKLPIRAAP